MAARRFNETDIDFEGIDGDLAKLAPPKLSLKDVLDRLRDRMVEQRAKGVTVAQMHEVLKARGIEIGERSLKAFLDKGELPGRKAAKSVANATASEEGGIRSERHGAKRRAREGDIARRAMSRGRYAMRRTWERARATAMARQRRACCEAAGKASR